jgi:NAD:arginine ADP-ribosyltransferase.
LFTRVVAVMSQGSFSEQSLRKYEEMVGALSSCNFSELGLEPYDYTRCVREDGTAYGTSGKCRKGTKQAKEVTPKKPKRAKANKTPRKTKSTKAKVKPSKKIPLELNSSLEKLTDKLAQDNQQKVSKKDTYEEVLTRINEAQRKVKLSSAEAKSVYDYTAPSDMSDRPHKKTNACLRNPPTCKKPEITKEFVKEFDSALGKLPKNNEGISFYRGVNFPLKSADLYAQVEKLTPGSVLKDPGFGSYSLDEKTANGFLGASRTSRSVLFVSKNRSLTPVNMYSDVPYENEAILPRNTEQTVRKVTKREDGVLVVELD